VRTLGKFTTATAAALTAFGLFVAVRSIPDIRRYLSMRRM
jgi:hypothetical protein